MASPTLVYDDDCDICTRAARFVERNAAVEIVGFSALSADLRERLPAEYESCAHLLTENRVFSCGAAMERAYELTGLPPSGLLPFLRRVPGYATAREVVYRWIADNRALVARLLPSRR